MADPLVSVVIATWNTADYLSETVASALDQTWPNLEVIVIDDGSTDHTHDVIAPFMSRIRYEPRVHRGLAAARNEGIRLATGDFVALLDADDLWHPEKIATQVDLALQNPESGLIACNGVEFDGERILSAKLLSDEFARVLAKSSAGEVTGDLQQELIHGCGICCPSQVLLPRDVLKKIGPFIDSNSQDYDYYLRVSLCYPITVHSQLHVKWRYRSDSMSGPRSERWIRWRLNTLPVLRAHMRRCRPEHRAPLDMRIHQQTSSLGYYLMTRGRVANRLSATSELLTLLRVRPWPPSALVHLAGLWYTAPVPDSSAYGASHHRAILRNAKATFRRLAIPYIQAMR